MYFFFFDKCRQTSSSPFLREATKRWAFLNNVFSLTLDKHFSFQFVSIEALVAAISDLTPSIFDKRWKKAGLNFVLSMSLLLLGLPSVTEVTLGAYLGGGPLGHDPPMGRQDRIIA